MKYPASSRDIDRFEEHNKNAISVNVYEIQTKLQSEGSITLHRRTHVINAKYHINLLLTDDGNGKNHYVYIKDYDRLVGGQTNKRKNKLHHCRYCQHGFVRKDLLTKHMTTGCLAVEGQSVKLPEKGETIHFKSIYRKQKCPFVIYGDFECLTTISKSEDNDVTDEMPFTKKIISMMLAVLK